MALSQREIEELINSMLSKSSQAQSVQVTKPRLRVYDFKRPDKFSKDHLRGVQFLFDSFCRQLTSYYSGLFRTAIHAGVTSVDQAIFEEFAGRLGSYCCVPVVNWQGLPSNMLISIPLRLAIPMVDRLCGGSGNSPANLRPLTEIEMGVLMRVAQGTADMLAETVADLDLERFVLRVGSLETNPLFVSQAMAPNEIVLSVTVSLKFGNQSGDIEFCLPYILLEPILPALSAHRWFARRNEARSQDNVATQALGDVGLTAACCLGTTNLTMRDVMSLRVGDVLELDTPVRDCAVLYVLGKPMFRVKVGRVGNRLAVRVVSAEVDNGEEGWARSG